MTGMTAAQAVAERVYQAMADDDGRALAGLLHPEFRGRVSAGLPLGLGGPVDGPEQMLQGVWFTVAKAFDVRPEPDEFVPVGEDRVIVIGFYRGQARETGRSYTAAFVHDIRVRDDRIASLVQITDTAEWHAALTPA